MTIQTILAGGALALLALPAAAATVTATYTGTVSGIYDQTGVFGGDPADPAYVPYALQGQAFTLTFNIDTDVGVSNTSPGSYDQVYGGSQYNTPSPVSASLEIGGVTQVVGGDWSSSAYIDESEYSLIAQNYLNELDASGDYEFEGDYVQASLIYPTETLPTSLEDPFAVAFGLGTFNGDFQFYQQQCNYDPDLGYDCLTAENAYGTLAFASLVVTVDGVGPPSPVPLPASGTLLLAAAGGLGLLRRRRR